MIKIKYNNIMKIIIFYVIISITLIQSTNAITLIDSNNNDFRNNFKLSSFASNLSYRPEFFDFGDKYKGVIDNTSLEIWNSGCCHLQYSIVEDCSWIEVEPNEGSSDGEHDNITVEINTSNLSIGNYLIRLFSLCAYEIFASLNLIVLNLWCQGSQGTARWQNYTSFT